MTKYIVTEYRPVAGKISFLAPVEVDAENGSDAICKAMGLASISVATDPDLDRAHAQFDGYGRHGAHARLEGDPLVLRNT